MNEKIKKVLEVFNKNKLNVAKIAKWDKNTFLVYAYEKDPHEPNPFYLCDNVTFKTKCVSSGNNYLKIENALTNNLVYSKEEQ